MEEDAEMRPNIRIEIHNNLAEAMEVEDEKASGGEEGEILDVNEPEDSTSNITYTTNTNPNKKVTPELYSDFPTGINTIGKSEREMLEKRAKRFALESEGANSFTEKEMQELHESLGIKFEEERNVRFEALHIRGTSEMGTEDIVEYFSNYSPAGIEWISDDSCNVVWPDNMSSGRALFFLSKHVKGMPVEPNDTFTKDVDENSEGISILLKNKNREVQMSVEDDIDKENGDVHVSDITVPVPPGYWRLGIPHVKAKILLLRFSLRTDKKPFKAERFSEYYKKQGLKGLISESKKMQFMGIFSRNPEIETEDNKNPWGNLAKNWYEDVKYAEQDYKELLKQHTKQSTPLQHRLGFKRAHTSEEDEKETPKPIENKTKIPRMRMYADEEEEKIKRKRQLELLKTVKSVKIEKTEDLRDILRLPSRSNPPPPMDEILRIHKFVDQIDMGPDLGTRLKNRQVNNVREILTAKRQRELKSRLENTKVQIEIEPEETVKNRLSRANNHESKHRRKSSPSRRERRTHKLNRRREESDYEENYDDNKTSSKVTVVIKKPKQPAVASTVWSRIHNDKERLSENKLRSRKESSDSSSESSSSSSSSSSEEESTDDESAKTKVRGALERPGFTSDLKSRLDFRASEHKSPLRIEISNDHFRRH